MPQENGWATGQEYCEADAEKCPYCGSEAMGKALNQIQLICRTALQEGN